MLSGSQEGLNPLMTLVSLLTLSLFTSFSHLTHLYRFALTLFRHRYYSA